MSRAASRQALTTEEEVTFYDIEISMAWQSQKRNTYDGLILGLSLRLAQASILIDSNTYGDSELHWTEESAPNISLHQSRDSSPCCPWRT